MLELTLERVLAQDEQRARPVADERHVHRRAAHGRRPTGRRIELRGLDWLEVEDDKVVRNTAFADGAALARGIGLLPPQDSAAEKAMFTAFNAFTKARGAVSGVLSR